MIKVSRNKKHFSIFTKQTVYVCAATEDNRLCWVGYGRRAMSEKTDGSDGSGLLEPLKLYGTAAQDCQKLSDEVPAFGDECIRESGLKVFIPESDLGHGDRANLPIRDLRLRFKGHTIGQPFLLRAGEPTHGRPTEEQGGDWLILHLEDKIYPFQVDLCLRPHEDSDVIERFLVLRNLGEQKVGVEHAYAASLQFPLGHWEATTLQGAWGGEFSYQHQSLSNGATVIESRGLNTGLAAQPTMLLQRKGRASRLSGETYACHLAWSGNWRIYADQRHDNSLRIHLGENFPDGLSPLIDEVHRLGMRFGIWFEPEMVNPDSDLYRQHPDWVLHFPQRDRVEARNQLILDFGNPEVVEYIWESMDKILGEYPIDFIKWDMNRTANAWVFRMDLC
jgi:alpha-galactosidase